MSQVLITTTLLDDLADSISAKSGESTPMTIAEMTDAVDGILVPSGAINITQNGSNIDVASYATANVSVQGGTPNLQTKTKSYTPTESAQTESVTADTGYDGLDEVGVTVNAISSTYVGSGITRRDGTDLSASGATVTVPSGFYESQETKSVASGTAGTPTATKGTVSSHSVSVTPSVTNVAGYISGGTINGTAVTVSASELVSGSKSITNNGSNIDVANYATANVSVAPNLQAKTNIAPTESSQTITADGAYDGLSSVQINAISSTYVGSGITRRDSASLSANGATVTVPSGYYQNQASKAVASGTAGTPTATKGTVTNHSVSVTPSVTNVSGYITGSTKTGTAVTVSASELVSGTKSITDNGTNIDVTNYAAVDVSVSGGGGGMNFQISNSKARVSATAYTATTVTLTVAVSGTYNIYWAGYCSSSGGTNGSRLYKNGSALSTTQTSFTENSQVIKLTNISLAKDDVLTLYARSRSTSYYMTVMNLTIEQTA